MLPQRPPLDWRREYLPIRQRYSVAPNITGSTNNSLLKAGDADGLGCVTWGTASPANLGQGSGRYSALMNINASKSNAIFGASSTVQPAGLYAQFLIRYS